MGSARCAAFAIATIGRDNVDHSDDRHSLTYAGLDPLAFPGDAPEMPSPALYQGTMHLLPVVDGKHACHSEHLPDAERAQAVQAALLEKT